MNRLQVPVEKQDRILELWPKTPHQERLSLLLEWIRLREEMEGKAGARPVQEKAASHK